MASLARLALGLLVSLTLLYTTLYAQPAQSHLDRILAERVLKVCVWPDYYGISFRNPRTQELAGIDVDLARELARDLDVRLEFVDSSFANLIGDVLGDRCDVAMFAIGITAQRAEKLRFTSPHLASDIYAITTRTNRRIRSWDDIDQPGVIVAVAKGTLHEPVMRDKLRHAQLQVLASPHAREQEVESGRADVFMTDFPYSRRMLDNADWARLVAPSTRYHVTPYAWAIAPGDDRWHQRLEAFLATIRDDGRLMAAARRHGLDPIIVNR
ncbi:ABC transporter substrate-binding protein [Azoarcus olearius]|uniref:Cyclohexadienyl dehydratase n=1 Tax=Azoarcus sp. (strain BH72) TaxID=418699 RepID=A1K2R1_AZOSB|nr:ABC transporter substrate-binding protein [Azoarcus olearius]CAL93116.1 putative cyclohexadienyl dehydratase [Azoarcus olearius]